MSCRVVLCFILRIFFFIVFYCRVFFYYYYSHIFIYHILFGILFIFFATFIMLKTFCWVLKFRPNSDSFCRTMHSPNEAQETATTGAHHDMAHFRFQPAVPRPSGLPPSLLACFSPFPASSTAASLLGSRDIGTFFSRKARWPTGLPSRVTWPAGHF